MSLTSVSSNAGSSLSTGSAASASRSPLSMLFSWICSYLVGSSTPSLLPLSALSATSTCKSASAPSSSSSLSTVSYGSFVSSLTRSVGAASPSLCFFSSSMITTFYSWSASPSSYWAPSSSDVCSSVYRCAWGDWAYHIEVMHSNTSSRLSNELKVSFLSLQVLSEASSMTIELSKIISYLSFASSLMCSISIFVCQ